MIGVNQPSQHNSTQQTSIKHFQLLAKVQDEFIQKQKKKGLHNNSSTSTRKNSLNPVVAGNKKAQQTISYSNQENADPNYHQSSYDGGNSFTISNNTIKFFPNNFSNVLAQSNENQKKQLKLDLKQGQYYGLNSSSKPYNQSLPVKQGPLEQTRGLENYRKQLQVQLKEHSSTPYSDDVDHPSYTISQKYNQRYDNSSSQDDMNQNSSYSVNESKDEVHIEDVQKKSVSVSQKVPIKNTKREVPQLKASCPMNTEMSDHAQGQSFMKVKSALNALKQQPISQAISQSISRPVETHIAPSQLEEPKFSFEREILKERQMKEVNSACGLLANDGSLNDHSMYGQIIQMLIGKITFLEMSLQNKSTECEQFKAQIAQLQEQDKQTREQANNQLDKSKRLQLETNFDKTSFKHNMNGKKDLHKKMNSTFY